MKGGNTFWIIWGGVLVLWLVLRYFAKQRMHPVPGMETETYKKAQLYSVFGTTATFMFALVLATILSMQGFAGRVALAVLFIFAGLQVTKAAVQKVWCCPVCGKPLPVQTGILGVVVIPVSKCPHCGRKIP